MRIVSTIVILFFVANFPTAQSLVSYDLIFEDNFDELNEGAWWIQDCIVGNPNDPAALLKMRSNATVVNGRLRLHANDNNPSCGGRTSTHSIGEVTSSATYLYGYFEFRAHFSRNREFWPAIWFLPRPGGNPEYLELDIMETCSKRWNRGYTTTHVDNILNCNANVNEATREEKSYTLRAGWNKYGVEWTPSHIKIYINGSLVKSFLNRKFHTPMNVVLTASTGKYKECQLSFDGSNYPAFFHIDYFKAYQRHTQSMQIAGPENVCMNSTNQYYWPYYQPFSEHTISHPGFILENDVNYAVFDYYPENDPRCNEPISNVSSRFDLKAVSPGLSTIRLNIDFDSGHSESLVKRIYVGVPPISGRVLSGYSNNIMTTVNGVSNSYCNVVIETPGIENFTWSKNAGNAYITTYNNGKNASINGLGYVSVTITGQGECGLSTRNVVFYRSGRFFTISPNPVLTSLTVKANKDSYAEVIRDLSESEIDELELLFSSYVILDEYGSVVMRDSYRNAVEQATIDVGKLKSGKYVIVLINRDQEIPLNFVKI